MPLRLQFIFVALLASIFAAGWWSYDSWGGDGATVKKTKSAGVTLVLVEKVILADDRFTIRTICLLYTSDAADE